MSRGSKKRKAEQRKKRNKKIHEGKRVPFDLQNSPKKYPGLSNRFCYKSNIHNLIYKDGNFHNVKYQASNITKCNFKNASLLGVDFVGCNLKGTNFSGANLEDVVFVNCKMENVKFLGSSFKNVYFVMTDISGVIDMPSGYTVMNKYPHIELSCELREALVRFSNIESSYRYHVLHVKKEKANLWTISILEDRYGEGIGKALLVFSKKPELKNLYTVHAYAKFIEKYLKM